jgi:hypothetical protein
MGVIACDFLLPGVDDASWANARRTSSTFSSDIAPGPRETDYGLSCSHTPDAAQLLAVGRMR